MANTVGEVITNYSYYDYTITRAATATGSATASRGTVNVKIKSAYINYTYIPNGIQTYVTQGSYYYDVTSADYCFSGMMQLTYAYINYLSNSSLKSMKGCFQNCNSLTTLYNQNMNNYVANVTDLSYCFAGCNNLTTLPTLPSAVTNISYMFQNCTSITSMPTITTNVKNMSGTFYGCTRLSTFTTIPSGVTNMSSCFMNTNITSSPSIPSSVTNLDNCFQSCSLLANAPVLPSALTTASHCFDGCSRITTAPILPTLSLTNISYMFKGCTNLLIAPTIPAGIQIIDQVFFYCSSLSGNITFNSTLLSTYTDAFAGTTQTIFIIPGSDSDTTNLRIMAAQYGNVHYDIEDNPKPNIEEATIIRVAENNSTVEVNNGEWLYIVAKLYTYVTYLPSGQKNNGPKSVTITLDNSSTPAASKTSGFSTSDTDMSTTVTFWVNTNDVERHTISIVTTDIKNKTSDTFRGIISGSFATMDFHAGGDGVSIGTFSNGPGFVVDMETTLQQGVEAYGNLEVYGNTATNEAGNIIAHNGVFVDKDGNELTVYHLEQTANTNIIRLVPGAGNMTVTVPAVWG